MFWLDLLAEVDRVCPAGAGQCQCGVVSPPAAVQLGVLRGKVPSPPAGCTLVHEARPVPRNAAAVGQRRGGGGPEPG